MRIVSLLPSGTEIVCTLGLGDDLAGVTFECDHPPLARTKPVVSGTALRTAAGSSARDIDDAVRALVADGQTVYTLDVERIRAIQPDLVIAQDLCHVCAVPAGAVDEALAVLGCRAAVVSLDPSTLDEVIGCVETVGRAARVADRAAAVSSGLRARVDAVRRRVETLAAPTVLALEWSDPLFTAGHWVPDMIEAAGGRPVLADAGARSRVLDWDAVGREPADVVVVMPCGYRLDAAVDAARQLAARPELSGARAVWAVDADAYFSRPGPRVVDGVELLSLMLHPVDGVAADGSRAVRIR